MWKVPVTQKPDQCLGEWIDREALAEAMEVTRQTIISLEKEKYTASLNLAYKLAQYFNTTIEDIFFSEDE